VGYCPEALLFGEYQSRILVTLEEENLLQLRTIASDHLVTLLLLGKVGGSQLKLSQGNRVLIQKEVAEMEKVWKNSLTCLLVESP
jgi:phosphoribosylformylglycinamidine synthase subunit PurL